MSELQAQSLNKHFAGIVTGLVYKEGFFQVTAMCNIKGTDKNVNLALPISADEKQSWAMRIGEKVVLTLSTVESLE